MSHQWISLTRALVTTVVAAALGLLATVQAHAEDLQTAKVSQPYVEPVTGWYWNAQESGRGFAIERQGDRLFLAGFMYEDTGEAVWYTSTLLRQGDGSYTGNLDRFQNGQSLLGTYRTPTSTNVGTSRLAFDEDLHANLDISPTGKATSTITLERFPISAPAFQPSSAPFRNGWYWNPAQSGRGFFIEVQGSTAFIATFMYKDDGRPTWYTMTASLSKTLELTAPLLRFENGQSLLGAYRQPTQPAGNAGVASFSLSDSGEGLLQLPNGKDIDIKAFDFNGGQPDPKDNAGKCEMGQQWAQGKCITPSEAVRVAPIGMMLRVGVVPQMGQTYQLNYCIDIYSCMPLHVEKYVSYEDLRDEDTPEIVAYVYEVMREFNEMLRWFNKQGKSPDYNTIVSVLGNAVNKAIANESPTAVQDARAGFADRGFPLPGDTTVPADTASCTPDAGSKRGSGSGPVLMTKPPEVCYKKRLYTFGWVDTGSDGTVQDACKAAQQRGFNGDLDFFNAQNVSACYCSAGGKVNSVTMNYLCNVFFDAGN